MISFDSAPTVYWFLCYIFAVLVIAEAYFKKTPHLVFVILSILLFIVCRLPVIVFNRELNPDESQMISHAITLLQDPVYWRSVDGTTIGPLDNYFISIPGLLGFTLDYTATRFMGVLANCISLVFLFLCIKNWASDLTARVFFLLPLLYLAFTQEVDFVHYSSEQVPLLLVAICLWLLSEISTSVNISNKHAFLLGFVAGLVPFAKLQFVPPALVIGVSAAWFLWVHYKKEGAIKPFLFLLFGAVLFPVIVTVWTISFQVFNDFVDFYLLGNVIYANGNNKSQIDQLFTIVNLSPDFKAYLAVIFLAIVVSFGSFFDTKRMGLAVKLTIALVLLASAYAVTKSGNDFVHYLNLLLFPTLLLATIGSVNAKSWVIVLPVLLLGWFVANDIIGYKERHQLNQFDSVGARKLGESPVVAELKKYSVPKDYLVVWGWQCTYYVEAQLAQGTAENHSERSIFNHEMREEYRQRYIEDIHRTKPAIILDAVGKNSSWVQDIATQSISCFPALSEYVESNYVDLGYFDGTRLYVRNDRVNLLQ